MSSGSPALKSFRQWKECLASGPTWTDGGTWPDGGEPYVEEQAGCGCAFVR